MPPDTFAKLPVCVLINDPKKNGYRHQLQPMLHFLTNHKFDLLSYFYIINFLNLPLRALIHDLQKKNIRASTRTHDPFFDNPKITGKCQGGTSYFDGLFCRSSASLCWQILNPMLICTIIGCRKTLLGAACFT